MIYLLDGNEFNIYNAVESLDQNKNIITYYNSFNMRMTIQDKLKLASQTKELIHTQWLRGIGKTYELVRFAKENGYIVIHPNANTIKERENYKEIYPNSINLIRGNGNKNIVIDEGVTNIEELKNEGFNIITGFYTPKKEDNNISFKDKVMKTLTDEIEALTPKLQQTRENRDYGTYKNLINAYREILNLIQFNMENFKTRIK